MLDNVFLKNRKRFLFVAEETHPFSREVKSYHRIYTLSKLQILRSF